MKDTLKDTLKDYHTEQVMMLAFTRVFPTSTNPFDIYSLCVMCSPT